MTAPASNSYRDKYVAALKEQDRLESQFALQTDLLRKTLLQLGVAASGMDQSLDAAVMRLRDVMRGGRGPQIVEQMEKVQAAVSRFDGQRSEENLKAARAVQVLIDQYMELQVSDDIKKKLKAFSKALTGRLSNYRQYPLVLTDLAKLQQLALETATNEKAGLWTRLKGGKTLKTQTENDASESGADQLGQESGSLDLSEEATASPDRGSPPSEHALSGAALEIPDFTGDEDDYDQVARRIAATLANLVDNIAPNELIKHRVDIVRHRIDRGMDWYVLAVTLEDIRDILFLRYLQADEEFGAYLSQVKGELGSIRQALSEASEKNREEIEAGDTFADHVSSGVARIRDSVADQQNMDALKTEVSDHISYISDALKTFRQTRESASLTEQLGALVEHVKAIEVESEKTKAALEEQRHKATHDTLTGLPNREAYVERAYLEMQRFKRYCRPLTLAICDIDFFKKINDNYGHQAGDKVLKLVGQLISTRLRKVDFVARYGGEEFVILMPETPISQAHQVLDKIRAVVAKTPFRFKEKPVQITLSFGLAAYELEQDTDEVFERADKALYQAKDEGRNRCVIFE
jgi:diguanylate cyclase